MSSSGAGAVISAARQAHKKAINADVIEEVEGLTRHHVVKRRVFSQRLYGKLIEEVDPFVFEDTFCTISRKFNKTYVFRFSSTRSLFVFGPMNAFRRLSIYIVTHQLFDLFIIMTIVGNCIALGFDGNSLKFNEEKGLWETEDYKFHPAVEWGFLAIYTVEMIFKVISKGLILNKFSYLRNGWNVLDFVVVVFGFITESYEYFSDERDKPDLDLFRTFRVLRAVKTISILPGLRMIINSLLNAIIQLLEVMLLTAFCLCIFSLFALELYQGKLHHVCVLIKGSETSIRTMVEGGALEPILDTDPDRHHEYALWVNNRFNWLARDYPKWEYQPCGNDTGSRSCPMDYICLPSLNDNPDDGWTSFDNIFYSMLSTFQLITLDYWERLYELVMSTAGAVSVFFFIMVVFLGSFYLMNLMLAVVAMSYETEAHTWEQKPLTKHQKLALHRSDSTFSFDDPLKLNVTIMTSYRRRSPGEREMLARTLRNASIVRPTVGDTGARLAAAGSLTEAVMNMLGRRVSAGAPPSTPMTLTGTTYQPKDYTAELNARASEYIDVNTEPRIRPPASKAPSASVMGISHAPSLLSVDSSTSQDRIDTKTVLNMQATLATQYDRTRNDKKRFFDSMHPGRVRQKLTPIVTNSAFEMFITISIVLNTILLASEHYGMPAWLEKTIQYGSHSFSAIFAFECIIKIAALQRDYFSQYWNLFDLFVVLISIFDLILELLPNTDNYFAFRVVRLFRIFKLAQSWLTMKVLLNIIFSTFGALGNLTLVLAIFIYIFAILGMQVIGLRYTPENFGATDPIDEYFPRWNFMDFWHAFMMVFRTLCGEWIEPLWECLLCHKGIAEWKCFIIFLPILIFGNFIVLNLFLALLLNSFNTEEFKAQRDKEKEMSGKVNNLKKVVGMLMLKSDRGEDGKNDGDVDQMRRRLSLPVVHGRRESRLKVKFKAATHKVIAQNRKYCTIRAIRRADEKQGRKEKSFIKNPLLEPPGESNSRTSQPEEQDDEKDTRLRDCFPVSLTNYNNPCFRFIRNRNLEEWTKVRTFCLKICVHPSFEWVILVLILASSITLCFEDVYLDEKPTMKLTLFILNNCFTAIFIIEMIFKWMAFGLHKYFTTFWTLLDAFIVIVSIVTFAFDMKDKSWLPTPASQSNIGSLDSLKALRTLRALRPLRAISKWQGMKVVVNALLYAIPSIVNVLLVCLLFWLVFSIMGVQFFKGKFFKCVYSETGNVVAHSIVANMQTCCSHPDMSWINQLPNFDNVLQGYLSLFQVATFEGWMELMRAASDIPSHSYENPKRGQSYGWNAFFVVFIIFGSFFTLNLFIGVIIDNFNMLKKKYEGNLVEILLTPSQRRYYTAMKKLGRKKPQRVIKRPANKCLAICYDISVSRRFEVSIFVMIFLNMIVMSFEHHGQEQVYTQILEGSNSFFVAIYTLEALVKIAGMRHYYFTFPWNIFDFFLVVISIVIDLIIVETKVLGFPPTLLRVFRVFRIGRVLRLIKSAKGIRKLLFALIVSLPALFNIGALLALLTFIYAIVGMALFKDVAFYQPIDEVFSFQTFPKSMLMLFRLMTAAGWNDVLYSLTAAQVTCGSYRKMLCGREGEPKCSPPFAAVIFMVSYLILSFLIVINMYIAIILENFVEANRDEEIGIVEDDLEMFYVRWSRYDPSATQFINFDQLSEFLACLDPPLNIPRPNIVAIVSFNLPIARGNKIHCLDILHALVKHALGQVDDSEEFRKVQEQMELKFRKQFPGRKLLDIISSTRIWKIQHNAAIIIQRAWRAYFARTRGPDAIPYQRRGSLQGQPQTQGRRASTGSAIANTFARIGNFFSSDKDKGRKSSLPYQTTLKFTRNKDGSNEAGTETSAKQKNPKRVSFVEEIQEMNRETRRQEALQKSGLGGAGSSTQKK